MKKKNYWSQQFLILLIQLFSTSHLKDTCFCQFHLSLNFRFWRLSSKYNSSNGSITSLSLILFWWSLCKKRNNENSIPGKTILKYFLLIVISSNFCVLLGKSWQHCLSIMYYVRDLTFYLTAEKPISPKNCTFSEQRTIWHF